MEQPMTPNQIESAKESINFLTRTMLAYIAGVYLLAGAVGNYLADWFAWGVWSIVATIACVCMVILMVEVARLQFKIRRAIKQIGGAP